MANKFKSKEEHKAAARKQMAALRKKFPDKFNPKKNGARDTFLAKAARGELKKNRPVAPAPAPASAPSAPAPSIAAPSPVSAPPPAPVVPAATTAQILTPPPPAPAPPQTEPQFAAQSELFSAPPAAEIPVDETNAPPPAPDAPPPGNTPPPNSPGTQTQSPGINRALAMMVWGMILQMAVLIFGEGMLPQKFKTPAGDIDENENVIQAWCDYFDSLGMTKLSPLWNLILTICAYFLIRVNHILLWFKARKKRNAPQPGTPHTPPTEKPEAEQERPEETQRTEPARREDRQPPITEVLSVTKTGSVELTGDAEF